MLLLQKINYLRKLDMLIKNNKPFKVIGYGESTLTQETLLFGKEFVHQDIGILTPQEFKNLKSKDDFQYFIGFGLDLQERRQTVDLIDDNNCDCVTYVHDTALVFDGVKIGKGSCVANFSSIMQGAIIGDHCFIETYCLVSHGCIIGKNTILHSGTMIAGKTTVGENCMFNFKAAAINKISICNNTIIGAFSNVNKTIDKPGVYVGSPARFLHNVN
jgi:UDP-3-O-[3-hydroxymyristoyl] glucosamine N-acyltransferase